MKYREISSMVRKHLLAGNNDDNVESFYYLNESNYFLNPAKKFTNMPELDFELSISILLSKKPSSHGSEALLSFNRKTPGNWMGETFREYELSYGNIHTLMSEDSLQPLFSFLQKKLLAEKLGHELEETMPAKKKCKL